jgi:HAD superfamily hydrolase (TIGR01509 family)
MLRVYPSSSAILFDLDGTLADTDPLHAKAWQQVAYSHFGVKFTWADYYDACIVEGLSPAEFLLQLGADVQQKGARADKTDLFNHLLRTELKLAPGAEDFLSSITGAGITVAIVSGGSRSSVETFLAALWPGRPPDVTISREDTAQHKPHPQPYILAITRLGRSPSECIALEDTGRGIRSANSAGLHSILVSAHEEEPATEADLVVASLTELTLQTEKDGLVIRKAKAQNI